MAGGGRESSLSIGMGASRDPSGIGVLAFRTVAVASFLIVVMPNPDSRVGRVDFGFFGVLLGVH